MEAIQLVVVLLAVVAVVTLAAERIGIPYPILMVVGGLALGLIPAFSRIELDPELVLLLFLPPILFSAAFLTSPRELWRSIRPITLLAFGLVLTTTLAVAAVLVALVAWRAMDTLDEVDRTVDEASRSARRLDSRTRDLAPAVRDLRDAAQSLSDARQAVP